MKPVNGFKESNYNLMTFITKCY